MREKHYEILHEQEKLIHIPLALSWPVCQRVHKILVPTFYTSLVSMRFFFFLLFNKHVHRLGNIYPFSFYPHNIFCNLVLLLDSIALWWLTILGPLVNMALKWAYSPGNPKSLVSYTFGHRVPQRDLCWRIPSIHCYMQTTRGAYKPPTLWDCSSCTF